MSIQAFFVCEPLSSTYTNFIDEMSQLAMISLCHSTKNVIEHQMQT